MLRIFEQSEDVLALILVAIWVLFVPTIDSGKTVDIRNSSSDNQKQIALIFKRCVKLSDVL